MEKEGAAAAVAAAPGSPPKLERSPPGETVASSGCAPRTKHGACLHDGSLAEEAAERWEGRKKRPNKKDISNKVERRRYP